MEQSFALTVSESVGSKALQVRFIGNVDTRAFSSLDGFMERIHAEAIRLRVQEVLVDFSSLEFMNSSCFKVLISWLSSILGLASDQRYKVRFRSDPGSYWQRRSLQALRSF